MIIQKSQYESKEVQKQIKRSDTQDELLNEPEKLNEIDYSSESDSHSDEYEDFRKKFEDGIIQNLIQIIYSL